MITELATFDRYKYPLLMDYNFYKINHFFEEISMFDTIKYIFNLSEKPLHDISNQEKKWLFIKYVGTTACSENESVLRKLKTHIQDLNTEKEDFDQYYDKLVFGFILFSICYEELKYGGSSYAVTLAQIAKTINPKLAQLGRHIIHGFFKDDELVQFISAIGEHVLFNKTFALSDEIINFHIQNEGYKQFMLQRFAHYEPLTYDDQLLAFAQSNFQELAPEPAKALFENIDMDDSQFDYLTVGLVTCILSEQQEYPFFLDTICGLAEIKSPEETTDYDTLYRKVGRLVLEEKTLPAPGLSSLKVPNCIKAIIINRFNAYDSWNINDYYAKQIFKELDILLPHKVSANFDELSLSDENYDFILTGFIIYTLVLTEQYPFPLDRIYNLCAKESPTDDLEFFSTIGKLALNEKIIPLENLYSNGQIKGLSKLSESFFYRRTFQYDSIPASSFQPYQQLNDLLPPNANGLFDGFRIDKQNPDLDLLICGALISQCAANNSYPLTLNELYTVCSIAPPQSPRDFKHFYQRLGRLALHNQRITFDKHLKVAGLSDDSFDSLTKNMPRFKSEGVTQCYMHVKELYEQLDCHEKRKPFILPNNFTEYSEQNAYIIGLTIYLLAQVNQYPLSSEALKTNCMPKPVFNKILSIFATEEESNEPKNADDYDQLFFAIGNCVLSSKSLPIEASFIDDNVLGLSENVCQYLKISMDNVPNLLTYAQYEQNSEKDEESYIRVC